MSGDRRYASAQRSEQNHGSVAVVLRYAARGASILHTGSIQAGSKADANSMEWSDTWSAIDRSATFPMSCATIPDSSATRATASVAKSCLGFAPAATRAVTLTVEPKRSFDLRRAGPWLSPVLVNGIRGSDRQAGIRRPSTCRAVAGPGNPNIASSLKSDGCPQLCPQEPQDLQNPG